MGKSKTEIKFTDKGRRVGVELLVNDEPVSRMVIWKHDMRIGTVVVRMGGIGGMQTKPEHRRKGYAARVVRAGMDHMRTNGFDLSLLFGISDFYDRWHFVPCMASATLTLMTRDAEKAPKRHGVRPARESDMNLIRRIYHRNNYGQTGRLMRPRRGWRGFRLGSHWGVGAIPYVVIEKEKVVGYFVLDDRRDRCVVAELGYDDIRIFPSLVKAFALDAITRRVERIEVCVPPDHPFVEHAVLYGAEMTQTYPRNGEAMGALIDQQRLFEKMLPELTSRLQASQLSDWTGKFAVITDLDRTVLSVKDGQILLSPRSRKLAGRLRLSQERLVQLVLGYRSVSAVSADKGVRLTGNVGAVLEVLFAKGFPYIWGPDHF